MMWEAGRLTRLGGRAAAINDGGQIVGALSGGNGFESGFLWENGTTTALPSPAWTINVRGQIAGTSWTGDDNSVSSEAFLWENGSTRPIGVLPGFDDSVAIALNDSGDVLGYSVTDTPS